MSWAERRSFPETQSHGSHAALAASRSTVAALPAQLQQNCTLDLSTAHGLQKVMTPCDEEDHNVQAFYFSGLTGQALDTDGSLYMLEKMPSLETAAADFNIVFKPNVNVLNRTFEENTHFILKRNCGSGVSGQVTAYMDTRSNETFVRKKIKDGSKLRMEELKAMLTLNHPGICSVYGLMVHGGSIDILMPDAGHPLRDVLRTFRERGISADKYWAIVTDMTLQGFRSLKHMHQRSVFHMDIKPENFLAHLNREHKPVLMLADFGSAVIGQQPVDLRLQMTPEYMAPELWALYQKVGRSSGNHEYLVQPSFDTYAFGMTVYFMCTHKHFMLEAWNKKDFLIPPDQLQLFVKQSGMKDPTFAFKFLLMTRRAEVIPALARHGPWIFTDVPPPSHLVEIIMRTLDPNPKTRWTCDDVITYLTGEPGCDTNTSKEEATFKTPMQATDSGSGVQFEMSALDQNLNLRVTDKTANTPGTATPISQEEEDTDVRSFNSMQQPVYNHTATALAPVSAEAAGGFGYVSYTVEPEEEDGGMDVAMARGGGGRPHPMRLNSEVDLQEMDVEDPLQTGAQGVDKSEIDMDMHLGVTCRQSEVPDPRVHHDPADLEVMKKKQAWAELGMPDVGQGSSRTPQFQFTHTADPVGVEGVVLRKKGFKQGSVADLGAPQQAAVYNILPPPTTTSIGKGGSLRCPTKHGSRKGKYAGMESLHRGVAQLGMKANMAAHSKNLAYLTHNKFLLMKEQEHTDPISFCVASSARPNLAARVMPPPPFAPFSGDFSAGSLNTMALTTKQPVACTSPSGPPQSFVVVNPWAVVEPARNPVIAQPSSSEDQAICHDVVKGAQATNMPNFSLLGVGLD